jgi:hypothetical protein
VRHGQRLRAGLRLLAHLRGHVHANRVTRSPDVQRR